jgi:hypothetical protein
MAYPQTGRPGEFARLPKMQPKPLFCQNQYIHNYILLQKKVAKVTAQSKQSHFGRRFAKSGHLANNQLLAV